MKYDCTKVLDYQHEANRCCEYYTFRTDIVCATCEKELQCDCVCTKTISVTDRQIKALQKWSDEHPEQKRFDKFKELLKGTEFEAEFTNYTTFDEYDVLKGKLEKQTKLVSKHTHKWWDEVCD